MTMFPSEPPRRAITAKYIMQRFVGLFSRYSADRREGILEMLQAIHERQRIAGDVPVDHEAAYSALEAQAEVLMQP